MCENVLNGYYLKLCEWIELKLCSRVLSVRDLLNITKFNTIWSWVNGNSFNEII